MNNAPLSSSGKNPLGIIVNINSMNKKNKPNNCTVFFGLDTKNLTTSRYFSFIESNQLSNFCINSKSAFSVPSFKIIEQRAGDKVNATMVDKPIDVARHNPNCLNI